MNSIAQLYSFSQLITNDMDGLQTFVENYDWETSYPRILILKSYLPKNKIYLLIRWNSKSDYDSCITGSIKYDCLNQLQSYFDMNLLYDSYKLNKIIELYDQNEGQYYKLSKFMVEDASHFKNKYEDLYDLSKIRTQKIESIRIYSDFNNPNIMTHFSSWNNISDIKTFQKTNTMEKLQELNLGNLFTPDEYDILVAVNWLN